MADRTPRIKVFAKSQIGPEEASSLRKSELTRSIDPIAPKESIDPCVLAACEKIESTTDILERFAEDLHACGLDGEDRAAKLVYLALNSRVFERPISLALKGPSSAGKSHTAATVLRFFPKDSYTEFTAMSDRALAYADFDLKHKFLVLYEAAGMKGEMATYLMRSLLSEGRIRYTTVESTNDGLKSKLIEREGPTGLLTTTTEVSLHAENETRLLSIPINDSPEQTRRVMLAIADEGLADEVDVRPWVLLQERLASERHVVTIPFLETLARLVDPAAVRIRRDFTMLLNLVKSHAILHRATRSRDAKGRIVATDDDYVKVYDLVVDLISAGVEASVRPAVRETVEGVASLLRNATDHISLAAICKHVKLDKSSVSRRVADAIKCGYLANLETRQGLPAQIVLCELMPEDKQILPTPEQLFSVMRGKQAAK